MARNNASGRDLRPRDWTLLAIQAANGRGLTPVQLQKALFLLGQECRHELGAHYYQFVPYNYGPFDAGIYRDAEALSREGLIEIRETLGSSLRQYFVTDQGREVAATRRLEATASAIGYLDDLVAWVSRLSFQDLVRAIYRKYPKYRVNSVFQG